MKPEKERERERREIKKKEKRTIDEDEEGQRGFPLRTRRSQIRNAAHVQCWGPFGRDIWPASALEFSFGTLLVILHAALKMPRSLLPSSHPEPSLTVASYARKRVKR